jgi:hypothetical protein
LASSAKLVETGMGGRCVKVNTLEKGVNLDGGLGGGRESTLGTLGCCAKTTEGAWVGRQILFILELECLDEMVGETVVEVLSTQASITCLDLEDTVHNGLEGNIKGSSSETEYENVTLADDLLIETVGDGGSSDDAEMFMAETVLASLVA